MRLEREFMVEAPVDHVWRALRDPGSLAACIPDADLRLVDGVYAGRVTLTANGSQIGCEAALRAVDEDEDEHAATVVIHGRELGGVGIGSATVRSRCEPAASATRVSLTAELVASGQRDRQAAHERARAVFEQVAAALERRAATPAVPSIGEQPAPAQESASASALDTGGVLSRRTGLLAGAVIALALASWLLGRRRSGR